MITLDDRAREAARELRMSVAVRVPAERRRRPAVAVAFVLLSVVAVIAVVGAVVARRDDSGAQTRTIAPPAPADRLALVSGTEGEASWSVWLTRTNVCWEMADPDRAHSSCLPRDQFATSVAVGMTGVRLVVRLTAPDVVEVTRDGVSMTAGDADGVRLFAGIAPATASAVAVGRTAEGEAFTETVEAPAIPDVVGLRSSEAATILRELRFNVTGIGDPSATAVLAQEPAAGTRDLQAGDVHLTYGDPAPQVGRADGNQDGKAWWLYGEETLDGSRVCTMVQTDEHQAVGNCESEFGDDPVVTGTDAIQIVLWSLADGADAATIDYGTGTIAMQVIELEDVRVAWAVVPAGATDASATQTGPGFGGDTSEIELAGN
jgi:hypothetical protein